MAGADSPEPPGAQHQAETLVLVRCGLDETRSLSLTEDSEAVIGRSGIPGVTMGLRPSGVVSRRSVRIRCAAAGAIVWNLSPRNQRVLGLVSGEIELAPQSSATLGSGDYRLRVPAFDGSIDTVEIQVVTPAADPFARISSAAVGVPTGSALPPSVELVLAVRCACAVRDGVVLPPAPVLQRLVARYERRVAPAVVGRRWERLLASTLEYLDVDQETARGDRLTTIAHRAYGAGFASPLFERLVTDAIRDAEAAWDNRPDPDHR